jgi:response regulator RpfG family c-di-GMP phosphodiesterase
LNGHALAVFVGVLMNEKILFVDDEENILHSLKRELRKRYEISTASSGAEALAVMQQQGPFAVIVSDMRMPEMNGIQLLTMVKDLYPDTVRLMLTGNADQETAIEAVNKGAIFRFLNKPCPTSTLVMALALALRQYRLLTAEKELLDKTLKGSITVLSEVLGLANPIAFGSALRIKKIVVAIAEELQLPILWQYEIAAMMSQIGCITIPGEIINKIFADQPIDREEEEMYLKHPQVGAKLLEKIPRLEAVAAIIAEQFRRYDSFAEQSSISEEVALGAQLLKVANDFDTLRHRGMKRPLILQRFEDMGGAYNPEMLSILERLPLESEREQIISVPVRDMAVGMVVDRDIFASNGALVAPQGQEVTWSMLQGLKNFSRQVGIREPVWVRVRGVEGESAGGKAV